MKPFPPLASLAVALILVGCSAFPDVTYADETEEVSADDDGALGALPGAPGSSSTDGGVDASESPGSEPPPGNPADAAPGPGPACKSACVGTACTAAGTCDRCKDACKGQTKKCCANVDPATSGGVALSCVADHALCPGESP